MSFLKKYFNKQVNQFSPADRKDYELVIKKSKDGEDVSTFVPVDTKKIIASNGSGEDWQLDTLLAAGISPVSSHTSSINARYEGVGIVADASRILDEELASQAEEISDEE